MLPCWQSSTCPRVGEGMHAGRERLRRKGADTTHAPQACSSPALAALAIKLAEAQVIPKQTHRVGPAHHILCILVAALVIERVGAEVETLPHAPLRADLTNGTLQRVVGKAQVRQVGQALRKLNQPLALELVCLEAPAGRATERSINESHALPCEDPSPSLLAWRGCGHAQRNNNARVLHPTVVPSIFP